MLKEILFIIITKNITIKIKNIWQEVEKPKDLATQ
jgi:hypothetical protein